MTVFAGVLLYLGVIGAAAGIFSLLKPLRFLGIRTRLRGLLALGPGFLTFAFGVWLPVADTRIEAPRTRLDQLAPVFQFREYHSILVNAPGDRAYSAIRTVAPEEIRFFRALTSIRFGKLLAADRRPVLDSFTGGWFLMLADNPGREIVIGHAGNGRGRSTRTVEGFKALKDAPFLKVAMSFRIEDVDATHCTVATETRVYACGTHVLRGFAAYWRMIYPGSVLIRRMWLRAIKLRAERPPSAGHPNTVA